MLAHVSLFFIFSSLGLFSVPFISGLIARKMSGIFFINFARTRHRLAETHARPNVQGINTIAESKSLRFNASDYCPRRRISVFRLRIWRSISAA